MLLHVHLLLLAWVFGTEAQTAKGSNKCTIADSARQAGSICMFGWAYDGGRVCVHGCRLIRCCRTVSDIVTSDWCTLEAAVSKSHGGAS